MSVSLQRAYSGRTWWKRIGVGKALISKIESGNEGNKDSYKGAWYSCVQQYQVIEESCKVIEAQ